MERYLVDYLRDNAKTPLARKYIEMLKVELDWFIYNYGEHISHTHHRSRKHALKEKIYNQLVIYSALYMHPQKAEKNVLSSIGFPDFKSQVTNLGYNMLTTILQPASYKQVLGNKNLCKMLKYKNDAIAHGCFNDICNETFFNQIDQCRRDMLKLLQAYPIKGVFLFTDEYFESKLLIDVAQDLNIPTFDFLHGLPGIYTQDVDSHTDYLMVWGQKIKQNYIDAGFNADKIIVVGNSKYGSYEKHKNLRNSIEDILVIPTSSIQWHQHSWEEPLLIDRSMIVLYLYEVQHVLERLNVKHARFRPHPSLNIDWVYGFLDTNFWSKDTQPLKESLNRASLVIGATSTVMLEAIMNGVNYLVFEPQEKGKDILRTNPIPPFDGKDEKLHVAFNENDLYYLLISKYQVNTTILDDYMQPLDLSPIKKLLLN
jgi:hypothetical protein